VFLKKSEKNLFFSSTPPTPDRYPQYRVGFKEQFRKGFSMVIQRHFVQHFVIAILCFGFVGSTVFAQTPTSKKSSRRADSVTKSKSLKSISKSEIAKMSERVDELIQNQLHTQQQKFNPLASDEIFVRRAYLNISGRIPTMDETTKFLKSKNQNKRAALIDELLQSDGYVSRQYNFWADLLRIKSRVRNYIIGEPYIDFVKDSVRENKPYDKFVQELLTADGPMMEKGNGATGYYLRDTGMPEDNMSNTIRIFLGTRLECAQCHDHPFDKWTQRQYFEMVAFTGGTNTRLRQPDSEYGRELYQLMRKQRTSGGDPRVRQITRRLVLPMTYGVSGSGTALARLPEGYMGKDANEGDIIKAKTMFGEKSLVENTIPRQRSSRRNNRNRNRNPQIIPGARQVDSRQAYAEWLTGPENPRFATVIANRLWKQAMGLALIEPVDDLNDNTFASNPELMEYLSELVVQLNFDLKQFLRVIYNTRAYQSEAYREDVVEPLKYNFNGPIVRRMSAEQIWDSLLTMTVDNVDQRKPDPNSQRSRRGIYGGDAYKTYEELKSMSPDDIVAKAEGIAKGGNRQAMMQQMRARMKNVSGEFREKRIELARKMRLAKRQGNTKLLKKLEAEKDQMVKEFRRKSGANDSLVRASELPSPAPAGHFLREFGQSDREQIDNGNTDPAVTQALSLMNGFVETRIAKNPDTVLMKNAQSKGSVRNGIDAVFLTMLSRNPTRSERKAWENDFRKNGIAAAADLIWTLVNTNEFIFIK
jgi:hypothetical protein